MPPETNFIQLTLLIDAGADAHVEELDRLTRQLRDEILELEVESVEPVKGAPAPEGTKGVDPMILGALAVTVGPTVLTKFLEFLHAWAMRREDRTVKLKIQTEGGAMLEVEVPATMSPAEVKQWINSLNETLGKKKGKK
jgi:hypothetical protein